jgi:hypothetical protein
VDASEQASRLSQPLVFTWSPAIILSLQYSIVISMLDDATRLPMLEEPSGIIKHGDHNAVLQGKHEYGQPHVLPCIQFAYFFASSVDAFSLSVVQALISAYHWGFLYWPQSRLAGLFGQYIFLILSKCVLSKSNSIEALN